jgi:hypothetical protein
VANAWGYPATTQIAKLSSSLVDAVPETSPISVVVQNSGSYYVLINGTAYPIDSDYLTSWGANANTPSIADSTLARFTVSSSILKAYVKINNTYYIMNNLYATPVTKYLDAYGINDSNAVTLPSNYFATTPQASYLVRSTDSNDSRMWLINQGQKILFSSFAQEANYSFVSQGVPITALNPAVLAGIPTSSSVPSLLVNKTGAGVKLLSFGSALGFPDGSTLTNYISANNPILTLSSSVYDNFALRKTTSRLVKDDAGNIYYMESGTKRLVQNPGLLNTTYAGIPITYLEGTTMVCIPNGTNIN